ncbi:DUF192 domain-containing protein [Bacillus sp. JJ1532]|uniref:DUF192 domain-containing protein n=1 Tax=Bacillus sp. JJ1474 TaxID=3122955 RepID=UPI002FFF156C
MKSKMITLQMNIKLANNFWKRLKGLLFYKKPITEEGLLITPCNSVHMFFMRFPIDVVFLDRKNQVVKVVSELKPWRMIPPVHSAHSTLELPVGTIANSNICVGDSINL